MAILFAVLPGGKKDLLPQLLSDPFPQKAFQLFNLLLEAGFNSCSDSGRFCHDNHRQNLM